MIPFDELVMALERYRRRQAGEAAPKSEPHAQSGPRSSSGRNSWRGADPSTEINLDEVETE